MPEQTKKHYITSVYYDVERAAKYIKAVGNEVFEQISDELTFPEFTALDTISLHKDICQRDLAKLLLKDRANTGRLLDALEEKEFITRRNDTKNNRLVRIIDITKKGETALANAMQNLQPSLDKLMLAISREEIKALEAGLKKFCTALSNTVNMEI